MHERRIEWSGAYTKVLGYDALEMGSSEDSWTSRIHPEDAPRVCREFERAQREHLLFELDYRFRHRDGHWRWMYDRGVPHFDAAGQVVELIGVLRDITGVRADQAEREAAAYRLRSVLDHMTEGVVVLDREARYLSVNERACELLRTRREDLIGLPVWERFPDSADAAVRQASARSIEDGQVRHLEILFQPWHSWFEVDIYPTQESLTFFIRDITQRKLTERSLRDSRVQQELALWEIGVWEWDLHNDTVYLSREWKSQLGYADHEIRNSFDEWEQRLHPSEREEMVRRVRSAAQSGRRSDRFELEFRMRHKDGSFRWILSRGVIHSDASGEPALLRGVHLDISDRKQAETLLEESRQRLNAFAQQLTEAIERERARISREIHDELGQALTRLKMDLGWLRRRLGESAQAGGPVAERLLEMGRFIDETLVSVRRLATELRPALLDNLGLAAALNAQMRQLAAQADIGVTQHLEPDLPLSSEQATGLYRIAQEALTNIVRHANARNVRCVLFLDNEGVTMEIQDDGCGFDAAVQPGRGLGLVGIAERARLLGGFAAVESEPGRGTLIRVHLPPEMGASHRLAG